MKYIDDHGQMPKATSSEKLYDKRGNPVISARELVFAKENVSSSQTKYSIKIHKNVPYDPWGMYAHRENYLETKFKAVSKSTFDYYMMYLKTRNAIYMTRSQRSFIND